MQTRTLLILSLFLGISGCVTGYTLVAPGVASVGDLQVQAGSGYNLVPTAMAPMSRKNSQLWTKDGPLLDRISIIPGVADGESLLVSSNKSAALPVYRKDMLPNDLEELIESTIVKILGEGNVAVDTRNLRPQQYGNIRGVMFDLTATVSDNPDYEGVVGGFIANERLYVIMYLAVEPHYFGKHQSAAMSVIESATIVDQTVAAK